mgnify:CR=1 FL=1
MRDDDWARLGEQADELTHAAGGRVFMRMRDGHCAALTVRRDAAGRPEFFCTIYAQRPEICRVLERGSPECLGEWEVKAAASAAAQARE